MKKTIYPKEITRKAKSNINNTKSEKYGLEPEVMERKSLKFEVLKMKFYFHGLNNVKKDADRKTRHARKTDKRKNLS